MKFADEDDDGLYVSPSTDESFVNVNLDVRDSGVVANFSRFTVIDDTGSEVKRISLLPNSA